MIRLSPMPSRTDLLSLLRQVKGRLDGDVSLEALAARSHANKARIAQDAGAMTRVAVVEQESAAQKILDRIRTIFRFRK